MMLKLAESGIVTLDDLAVLDSDELVGMLSQHGLEDDTEAGDIIMAARAHWFDDEESEAAEMPAGDANTDADTAADTAAAADTGDAPAAS